jgi:hypothetical protein
MTSNNRLSDDAEANGEVTLKIKREDLKTAVNHSNRDLDCKLRWDTPAADGDVASVWTHESGLTFEFDGAGPITANQWTLSGEGRINLRAKVDTVETLPSTQIVGREFDDDGEMINHRYKVNFEVVDDE